MSDLTALSPAELTDLIAQLEAVENAIKRRRLEAVAEYDRRELWRGDGATSMPAWLAGMLGLGRDTATEELRVAHALDELPHVASNFEQGLLSWDQTRALTEFVTPETDAHLASEARRFSAAHIRRMARRFKPIRDDVPEDAIDDRSFEMRWDVQRNRLRLRGQLPATEGAVLERAIDRIVRQAAEELPGPERYNHDRMRADALVQLASARIANDQDADRATVGVHVDASVLAGGRGMAELTDGQPIAPESARRMLCDARWYVVVDGRDGSPIGIGRVSRSIPPWLAREIRHRDGGCRFPGCGRRGWTSIHHMIHWGQGGPTDMDNLMVLCGSHHRLVHEGRWTIAGDPNGELTFIAPDGRRLTQGPTPLREEVRDRVDQMAASLPRPPGPSP